MKAVSLPYLYLTDVSQSYAVLIIIALGQWHIFGLGCVFISPVPLFGNHIFCQAQALNILGSSNKESIHLQPLFLLDKSSIICWV